MKYKIQDAKQGGFTIVELIVTIAILSFGIIGIFSAFSLTATLTYNIASRFTAANLAQEGLEIIRNIRDQNFIQDSSWSEGLLNCGLGCQADYKTGTPSETSANQLTAYNPSGFLKLNSDGFYGYDTGSNTQFKRKITITSVSESILKVDALVEWSYNQRSFSFLSEGYLYNWY